MTAIKKTLLVLLSALLTAAMVALLMPTDVLALDVVGALPVLIIFAAWMWAFFGGRP